MFDSVYSIALDILGKIGGDTTKHFDSAYEIALEILDVLGGDTTKKFDSVYSILLDIYQARFGSVLTNMDSNYSILKEINKAFDPTDTTNFDSPYSVLVSIDGQPGLIGHLFEIVTDAANTVIINGVEQTSVRIPEGETVTWSVSREHYVTQSGSYVMGDSDYSINVTLVLEQFTFTINPTPADATVIINGSERTSITADYGTNISWSVSATHYVTEGGTYVLTGDRTENVTLSLETHNFLIVATPANAVIMINGERQNSIVAEYGSSITWSVSADHYVTQNGSYVMGDSDYTEHVDLVAVQYTFTINPTPADATVIIDGQIRSSISAPFGTNIPWSVARTGYASQSGVYTVIDDHTENVTLVANQYTFTINPTPADAYVEINGEPRTSITAAYGTSISWEVSKSGYVTQSNTETLTGDTTRNVTLVENQYTFTINPTPADATVMINGVQQSSVTVSDGTTLTWEVSKTGYTTQTGSYTIDGADHTENVTLVEESRDYFAFDILSDGNIIWKMYNSNATPTTIEYRKNDGSWNSITSTTAGVTISVETGDVLEFRGDNDAYCNSNSNGYNYFGVDSGATFDVRGNIMSLIDSDDFDNLTTLPVVGQNFRSLFQDCTGLIDASQLELPATTIAGSCYRSMFYGCTGLVAAPALPATTLVDNCYKYMFRGCTGLVAAPALPATTVVESCYAYMFRDCTSITTAPALPATTLAKQCYEYMFNGCSSLNYIKCLATDTTATNCTRYWVYNVAATGTFIKDLMSSWTTGTDGIPTGWTTIDYASDTFTINPTPADATVVINGVERSFYTGMSGDVVTWSVSKDHYETQTGSYMLDGTAHTEIVTLVAEPYYFTGTATSSPTLYVNRTSDSSGGTGMGAIEYDTDTKRFRTRIPATVTSLRGMAYNNRALTSIDMSNGYPISYIDQSMFYNCANLASVVLPDDITSVKTSAFGNCAALTSIEFPDSVNEIVYDSLFGCTGLTSITVNSINPPKLAAAFPYVTATIYVPVESVNAYKTATGDYVGWSLMASQIQPIP